MAVQLCELKASLPPKFGKFKYSADPCNLSLLEIIGRGTYGVIHKAVWRGSIVAAKQITTPFSGIEDGIIKEIKAYQ